MPPADRRRSTGGPLEIGRRRTVGEPPDISVGGPQVAAAGGPPMWPSEDRRRTTQFLPTGLHHSCSKLQQYTDWHIAMTMGCFVPHFEFTFSQLFIHKITLKYNCYCRYSMSILFVVLKYFWLNLFTLTCSLNSRQHWESLPWVLPCIHDDEQYVSPYIIFLPLPQLISFELLVPIVNNFPLSIDHNYPYNTPYAIHFNYKIVSAKTLPHSWCSMASVSAVI